MAQGFDFQVLGLSKVFLRSVMLGVIALLLFLLWDAKQDAKSAQKQRDEAENARQVSDQALAKVERDCSDRISDLYILLLDQKRMYDTLSTKVNYYQRVFKKIKK